MKNINVAKCISKSFYPVFRDCVSHKHTFYWLAGGRGSTKSSFVSIMLPLLLMMNKDVNAMCLRKIGSSLRTSVYAQIQWGIDTLQVSHLFSFRMSPPTITYLPTGQQIFFSGVDEPRKLKSIKPEHGYMGLVWLEEFDQFAGMEEIRSINQTLLRGGPLFWEFCSYNPPKSRDNWVNSEVLYEDGERLLHKSTYLEVPQDWLGPQFFADAEKLKKRNETAYRHEYLGDVTGTGGSVFENVHGTVFTEDELNQFDRRRYGLDFGFAIDPLAFVAMHYDPKRERLYIFDEIYQPKLTNSAAATRIKWKTTEGAIIRADSAEPKSIREMREAGLNVYGAKKYPDSVDYGIKWLQSLDSIIIDKRRCPHTYEEFLKYEYERTKDGEYISAYPDKNNHAIDAVRYGCEDLMPAYGRIRGTHGNIY